MIIELVGKDEIGNKKILDPACGTGGFLRTYVHKLYEILLSREAKKWGDNEKSREQARSSLKSICDQNVVGIDFNPVLVRAAQMNLVMHGDGSSNIFHENSLLSWEEWDQKTKSHLTDGSVDVIVTNPPFGEELLVNDPHIYTRYPPLLLRVGAQKWLLRSFLLKDVGGYLSQWLSRSHHA